MPAKFPLSSSRAQNIQHLKLLASIVASEPGIELASLNQKLHSLGWDEVDIDYHCLQIAIACHESEGK
jgi:hypothetical protein